MCVKEYKDQWIHAIYLQLRLYTSLHYCKHTCSGNMQKHLIAYCKYLLHEIRCITMTVNDLTVMILYNYGSWSYMRWNNTAEGCWKILLHYYLVNAIQTLKCKLQGLRCKDCSSVAVYSTTTWENNCQTVLLVTCEIKQLYLTQFIKFLKHQM